MFETTSMNLFTNSVLGGVLTFVSFTLSIVLGVFAVGWLYNKVFKKLGVWLRYPFGALSVVAVLACPMLWIFYGPLKHYGELEGVTIRGQGDGRTISALFYSYSKSGRQERVKIFSIDGRVLSSEGRSYQMFKGKPKSLWTEGSVELMKRGDELTLVDFVSRAVVIDVDALLDKRFGAKKYRFKTVQAEQLVIEQRDGKMAYVSLRELVPQKLLVPIRAQDLWKSCHAIARATENKTALYGLLRAHKVQLNDRAPCRFALSSSEQLVLHRASAFGEDLDYRLSAVSVDGAKVLWTTDLSPVLGQGLNSVGIYAPWVEDKQLCFWLVRDKRALSQVCAKAKTGELLFSKVIF